MIKTCVVLNGKVINVGDWDYQYQTVEITPVQFDAEGKVIKDAVYENVAENPLPKGAMVEEREFEYDENRGWYEVSTPQPISKLDKLRIAQAEQFEYLLKLWGET